MQILSVSAHCCRVAVPRRWISSVPLYALTFLLGLTFGFVSQSSAADDVDEATVSKRYEAVVTAAYRARTARTALSLLDEFEAAHNLPASVQSRLQTQRTKFLDLERQGLVRLGNKWVKPEEFKEAAQKCLDAIAIAKAKLKEGDGRAFVLHLERASSLNPNAIEPNFLMGMVFSIRGNFNAPVAERYFEKVASLNPDYVPVLNNLALTEVKMGKYDEAYAHWKQLAEIDPRCPEMIQNLGRIEREGLSGRLPIPNRTNASGKGKSRYQLFAELAQATRKAAGIDDPNHGLGKGWLYSPLVRSWGEETVPPGDLPDVDKDVQLARNVVEDVKAKLLIPISSGTGFAISPNVVMTNRHVVEDDQLGAAAALTLQAFSGKESPKLSGKVIAVSDKLDLALIEVPDLNAKPIPLSQRPLERGVEAGIFGFPRGLALGATLKLTRGLVTSLTTKKFDGQPMFMLDAEANPGNSGGPVCDARGQVIGVLRAGTNAAIGDYSLAIPIAEAMQFAVPLVAGLNAGPPDAPEVPWKDVDAGVSDSVYLIQVFHRTSSMRLVESLPPQLTPPRSELEDVSCCTCNGLKMRRCTAPGCLAGAVTDRTWTTQTIDLGPLGRTTVPATKAKKYRCTTCDGKGYITCDPCRGTGQGADIR